VRPRGRVSGFSMYITSFVSSGGTDHRAAPVTPP
jgi:hypothetical protein